MSQNKGTLITSPIRPNDSLDQIATAFGNEVKGGHHVYATKSEMDDIIFERRDWGMLVTIYNDGVNNNTYQLKYGYDDVDITNNLNWVIYTPGNSSINSEWVDSIIDILVTPPVTPSDSDRYLVSASASGVWVGQDNKIAQYDELLDQWNFTTPRNGMTFRIDSDGSVLYSYIGTYSSGIWKSQYLDKVRYISATSSDGFTYSYTSTTQYPISDISNSVIYSSFERSNAGTVSISIDGLSFSYVKKMKSDSTLSHMSANDILVGCEYQLIYNDFHGVFQTTIPEIGPQGPLGFQGPTGNWGGFSIDYDVTYGSSGYTYSKIVVDSTDLLNISTMYVSGIDMHGNDINISNTVLDSLYNSVVLQSPSLSGSLFIKLSNLHNSSFYNMYQVSISSLVRNIGQGMRIDDMSYLGGTGLTTSSPINISFLMPAGDIGYQGRQGLTGPQGFQGNQGYQGRQGYQGNQGFQGVQGVQGIQGWQGFQGRQGFQGFQGFQGVTGSQGPQGNIGVQGSQGPSFSSLASFQYYSTSTYTYSIGSYRPIILSQLEWDTNGIGLSGYTTSTFSMKFPANEVWKVYVTTTIKNDNISATGSIYVRNVNTSSIYRSSTFNFATNSYVSYSLDFLIISPNSNYVYELCLSHDDSIRIIPSVVIGSTSSIVTYAYGYRVSEYQFEPPSIP